MLLPVAGRLLTAREEFLLRGGPVMVRIWRLGGRPALRRPLGPTAVIALVVCAAVMLPLVLPRVVGGLALLLTCGRTGLLGGWLDALGVRVAFSAAAVVLAQTFVAMPFLVISLEGALRSGTEAYERVAARLGAAPGLVLRRIVLPLVAPGLASGTVLAFARALGSSGRH